MIEMDEYQGIVVLQSNRKKIDKLLESELAPYCSITDWEVFVVGDEAENDFFVINFGCNLSVQILKEPCKSC